MSKSLIIVELYALYTTAVIYKSKNLNAKGTTTKSLQKMTSEHKNMDSLKIEQFR